MGCLDAVITEQLLRVSDVNCLFTNGHGEAHKDYLCLFRAVAVHLYGSAELETNAAKLFSDFLHESGHDAINIRKLTMNHLLFVKNAIKHNLFIYAIDIENGDFAGELARIIEMYEKSIIYCAKATAIAILMLSTRSSNDYAVLTVILLLSLLVISFVT